MYIIHYLYFYFFQSRLGTEDYVLVFSTSRYNGSLDTWTVTTTDFMKPAQESSHVRRNLYTHMSCFK
jgi:hypothetical protein